jgi:CBS domain-containing protein
LRGGFEGGALDETPNATAEAAMEIGPTTIRPNEPLDPLVERMHRRGVRTIVVSDLKGQLVGILYREDGERALKGVERT